MSNELEKAARVAPAAAAGPLVTADGIEFVVAALSDTLSAFGVPGASVLSAAAKKALQARYARKAEEAREILLGEIRNGRVSQLDLDLEESAAIMLRYARAVHEGVGRLNLRLLAAVFAGQIAHESVFADEFYRWADVLAGLRPDEVVVLARYLRHAPPDLWAADLTGLGARVYGDIYGAEPTRWGEFEATRGALLRTGFLSISVTGGAIGGAPSHTFSPTPRLQELGRLVELEPVLDRERSAPGA